MPGAKSPAKDAAKNAPRMKREYYSAVRCAALVVIFAPFVAHALPSSATYKIKDKTLQISGGGETVEMPLECEAKDVLVHDDDLFIACGTEGVLRYSLKDDPFHPSFDTRINVAGDAFELFVDGDRVWVRATSARPLENEPPETKPPGVLPLPIRRPLPVAAGPSIVAPRRPTNVASIAAEVMAFVPIGLPGGALVFGARASYRFKLPIALHAELAPLGLALTSKGNVLSMSAVGFVALDTDYLEVGFGTGGASVNTSGMPVGGPLLAYLLRLGAVDGAGVTMCFEVSNAPGRTTSDTWHVSAVRGVVQAPITARWMLLARGGGGEAGYGAGSLALRFRVFGDGGRRTLFVHAAAGAFGLFFSDLTLIGPSIGGGIEWRP